MKNPTLEDASTKMLMGLYIKTLDEELARKIEKELDKRVEQKTA